MTTETTKTICQTIDQLYATLANEINHNGARAYASGESMTFTGFSDKALDAANRLFATTVESDGAVRAYPFDGSSTFGAYLAEKLDTISWVNDGADQQ